MDLKAIKNSFFNYLKKFNENEVLILMNYLSFIAETFNYDYSRFKEILKEENINFKVNKYKDWINSLGEDIFDTNSTECGSSNEEEEEENDSIEIMSNDERSLDEDDEDANDSESSVFSILFSDQESESEKDYESDRNNLRIFQKKPQHIIDYLNRKYEQNSHPESEDYLEMAKATKLTKKQVRNWFSKKRTKKKDSLNDSQPRSRLPKETLNELLKIYEVNRFPTREEMEKIAKDHFLKFEQVKGWFETRRKKLKHTKGSFVPHSKEDVAFLKEQYEQNRYPSKEEINKMVPKTKLTFKQIEKWFGDYRCKLGHTKSVLYSDEINDYLLTYYEKNNYPDWKQKEEISAVTKLNLDQITDWFQNRRQKLKATHCLKIRNPKPHSYTIPEKELFYLLKKFDENQKPNKAQIEKLAKETNLNIYRVQKWFDKRRFDVKRKMKQQEKK